MAIDIISQNLTAMIPEAVYSGLSDKLEGLIFVFKTLGVLAIVYILYLIFTGISNLKRNSRVKSIDSKLDNLIKKIDVLENKFDKFLKTSKKKN